MRNGGGKIIRDECGEHGMQDTLEIGVGEHREMGVNRISHERWEGGMENT